MSIKLHVATDGLGNPLRIRLTAGQAHEMNEAEALIEGLPAEIVIGNTAFDSDAFRDHLKARRIATRYDKTALAYLSMISIACMMVWLR